MGNTNCLCTTRFKTWFTAEMLGLRQAQLEFAKLNNGLIFDNGGVATNTDPSFPDLSWRHVSGAIGSGSFLEWYGTFGDLNKDGTFNATKINISINGVIDVRCDELLPSPCGCARSQSVTLPLQAASHGYPVVLKSAPGPGTVCFCYNVAVMATNPGSCDPHNQALL